VGYSFAILSSSILNPMIDEEETDEISAIEDRIEALARTAERCRKFILASKIAIAGGVVLLLVVILGLFGTGQAALGSIALVLGGIVSLGSNVSTLRQTDEAIQTAEAHRARLISQIDLRLVADTPMKLV
jgi:prefoldin subunit 5